MFQNIDFMPTILSRFDTIFIVKDEHDQQKDIVSYRETFVLLCIVFIPQNLNKTINKIGKPINSY